MTKTRRDILTNGNIFLFCNFKWFKVNVGGSKVNSLCPLDQFLAAFQIKIFSFLFFNILEWKIPYFEPNIGQNCDQNWSIYWKFPTILSIIKYHKCLKYIYSIICNAWLNWKKQDAANFRQIFFHKKIN